MLAYQVPPSVAAHAARPFRHRASSVISHVVVVIQENRTIDNLFNGFCAATNQCANTVTTDTYTHHSLQPLDLDAPYGAGHSHEAFETDYANGAMTGFKGKQLAYVPASELTSGYWTIFSVDGVISDNVFAPNQGPSFPAHQYGIAGQAGGYDPGNEDIADNPGNKAPTYCGSGTVVESVSMQTAYPGQTMTTPLCRDHQTTFDNAVAKGFTWRYYAAGGKKANHNLWAPTQAIQHLYNSPYYVPDPSAILTDIGNGLLQTSRSSRRSEATPTIPSPCKTTRRASNGSRPSSMRSANRPIGTTPSSSSTGTISADFSTTYRRILHLIHSCRAA